MSGVLNTVVQTGSAAVALASVGGGVWLGRKWAPPGSRYDDPELDMDAPPDEVVAEL